MSNSSFTQLLQASRIPDAAHSPEDKDRLMALVYDELRGIARRQIGREDVAHTLQPTALVHEVYLRLVDQDLATVADRAHFQALCGRMMRQILVDHARRVNAKKRGAGRPMQLVTTLDPGEGIVEDSSTGVDLLDLHAALEKLAALDERRARVVELRVFSRFDRRPGR